MGKTVERYVAFLRAINLGGHRRVRMDHLRILFEDLRFGDVATFIASGNVIFSTERDDAAALEARIEKKLKQALGFEVTTILRTAAEVAAVARKDPFDLAAVAAPPPVMVLLLRTAPDRSARQRVLSYRSLSEDFHVDGREVYWLSRAGIQQSASGGAFAKGLEPATMRNVTTMRKLAAKYPPLD